MLIAIAVLALWLTSDLSQGSLSSMGAGLLPRWLAFAIGGCGLILLIIALRSKSETIEHTHWRGLLLVLLAIAGFAMTIRPFAVGPFIVPGLGLVIAGPFAVIVGGLATPEARLRELVILALVLTAFCMLLFGDLLNLPIPMFPRFLADYFAGIPAKLLLRSAAAILILAALAAIAPSILGRNRNGGTITQGDEASDD
jgi:hypothetical protein